MITLRLKDKEYELFKLMLRSARADLDNNSKCTFEEYEYQVDALTMKNYLRELKDGEKIIK